MMRNVLKFLGVFLILTQPLSVGASDFPTAFTPMTASALLFRENAIVPSDLAFVSSFYKNSKISEIQWAKLARSRIARAPKIAAGGVRKKYRWIGWGLYSSSWLVAVSAFVLHPAIQPAFLKVVSNGWLLIATAVIFQQVVALVRKPFARKSHVALAAIAGIVLSLTPLAAVAAVALTLRLPRHSTGDVFDIVRRSFLQAFLGTIIADLVRGMNTKGWFSGRWDGALTAAIGEPRRMVREEGWGSLGRAVKNLVVGALRSALARGLTPSLFVFDPYFPFLTAFFNQAAFGGFWRVVRLAFDLSLGSFFVTMPLSNAFSFLFGEKRPFRKAVYDAASNWRSLTPLNTIYWTAAYGVGLVIFDPSSPAFRDYFLGVGTLWSATSTYSQRSTLRERRPPSPLAAWVRDALDCMVPSYVHGPTQLHLLAREHAAA